MYYTKNIIFLSSLYVIFISSLVHSIPAPSSDDNISPALEPALFEKRWNCDSCPAKTVTDTCTITKTEHDTCTVTKTEHDNWTITKTEHDTCTVTKTEHDTCTITKTCTVTKTQQNTWIITKTNTDTATVTNENTKTNTETRENTKTNTVTHENTDTVTNTETKTNTVINEKTMINTKTNTVTDEKTKTNTVISEKTKTATDTMTLPPRTVTVTDTVTKSFTDTITKSFTKTVKTTTTVLPCNKPVPDTPCDSPMFTFVSPESGQVLKENKDFEVKYNITQLPGDQDGFVKDLQFYLVSSDLHCINQTIAQNADTTPTRVCNKSLQYTISACAKVPPAYYAIQVMYNFCNSTSGTDVCVFHECKRGVVVKRDDLYMTLKQ